MLSLTTTVLCSILALSVLRYWYASKNRTTTLPLPPGPKPLPIVGNIRDLSPSHGWIQAAEWKKVYGDIIHVQVFGKHSIFVNSYEIAKELLEKRSALYSDRPRLVMTTEIAGWKWAFAVMRYGSEWRKHRRLFHQFFHGDASAQYRPSHILESRRLLSRLLVTPENFMHHIRHLAAATIMRITYGIEVQETNDKYITAAEEAMYVFGAASEPGAFLVDFLPILKYIPEWFPGASFQRIGKRWNALVQEFKRLPFESAKTAIASGSAQHSAVSLMLQSPGQIEGYDIDEDTISSVTATAYAGGGDTTVSSLQCFFLAMVLNPMVQSKAQAEIDSVIGTDRLPEFEDLPSLPYVEAVMMEALRWHPVLPYATPHAPTEDDEFGGYFIPKGAAIVANVWAMLHDETIYPEPSRFNPERFMENGQVNRSILHPKEMCFGFGRRICPGRHLSMDSIFITIASVLASFDIGYALDEDGKRIPVEEKVTSGLVSHPVPFKCRITPRRESTPSLIQRSLDILH